MKTKNNTKQLYDKYVIPVYSRLGITTQKASGSWLWDESGKKYLDFFPGWGVHALGHTHPTVAKRVSKQLQELMHVPNTHYHAPQAQLAEALVKASFPGKVFFCNSGAETVEAAIKFARSYGASTGRHEVITMEKSFHGRTMGAMAATGQSKHQKGFDPKLPGFQHVPFGDIKALKKKINKKTVAIMLEVIQGEGGIHIGQKSYIQAVRKLCTQKDLLLIVDEVTTGMGRTGKMFAYQHYGITPDIMLLAKPVAAGFPIGVLVAHKRIADTWPPGSHATTFGGNPIVTTAGLATIGVLKQKKLVQNSAQMGRYMLKQCQNLAKKHACIQEIRGIGLMIGIELNRPALPVMEKAAELGLLINATQDTILRLYPALTVNKTLVDKALKMLEKALVETEDV